MDTETESEDGTPLVGSPNSTDAASPSAKRRRHWKASKTIGAGLLVFGATVFTIGGLGAMLDYTEHGGPHEPEEEASGGPGGGPGILTRMMNMEFQPGQNNYRPKDPALSRPSSAPTKVFYVYRSQDDEMYPPLNANAASLGGVLWYLQNEVVNRCDSGRGSGEFGYRRFKITRILRYKVTYKAPEPLYRKGMLFGTRVAFDSGKNTGSWFPNKDMRKAYDKYGYNVGCNILGLGPYPQCPTTGPENFCPIEYEAPVWYSFPGPCPTQDIFHKNSKCQASEPGGYCKGPPTGSGDCTWTYEAAGEINIDELVGIKEKFGSHYNFCKKGCLEYVKYGSPKTRDKGRCIDWWNGKFDKKQNKWRMEQVDNAFKAKYPNMPKDSEMGAPHCDFNKDAFYKGL